MADNKEVIVTDGFPEGGQEVDRTTGAYHGKERTGEFTVGKDGVSFYTGSLNELEEFVEKELDKEEPQGQQTALAEQIDTTDRANTVLGEWNDISPEAKSLLTPDQLSTLDDEAQSIVDVLGTAGYEQVSNTIDSLPVSVRDVVLKTVSAGVEELGNLKGCHEAILRALHSEEARELWLDAVDALPQIIQDAIDE